MEGTEVTVCPPSQTGRALRILFASLPDDEREAMVASLADALHSAPSLRQGLFVASERNVVQGAVLVQEQPGRTGLLWPPSTLNLDHQVQRRLARRADQHLEHSDVTMAQALVTSRDDPSIAALEDVGFRRLTELEFMIAQTSSATTESFKDPNLQFEPYQENQHERLASLVEATYVDTHDCPELNGVRDMHDVLTGYRATGAFDPGRWFFVSHQGADAGVLLLTEHAGTRQWELLYMGLVPHARRRGFGRAILEFALARAARAGAESVVLAVDVNNAPGIRLYERSGFRVWSRRIVYWKQYQQD